MTITIHSLIDNSYTRCAISSKLWLKMMNIIGHRGAGGLFPENTLFGFEKTLTYPIGGLELDVVISKDEKIVVSHEPWMNHLFCETPDKKAISEKDEGDFNLFLMNYSEIALFDCGKKSNLNFPYQKCLPCKKPLLGEVFELINKHKNNDLTLFLEIKSDKEWYGTFQPKPKHYAYLINEFLSENPASFNLMIQSFDPNFLNEFAAINNNIPLGLLVENDLSVTTNLQSLNFSPAFYNPHYSLITKELINFTKKHKLSIVPWTVNSLAEGVRLKKLGVKTIITDFPNLFL